jgi:simple sugar transport system permease protein
MARLNKGVGRVGIEQAKKKMNATSKTLRPQRPFADWLIRNRRGLSGFAIFLVLWILFAITAPGVFTNPQSYRAIFTTLPIDIMLAVPLVFVVASGESDLSFPSVFGLSSYAFAYAVNAGISPVIGLLAAFVFGAACGLLNGILITKIGLSSLVSTLGMNFFLRGLINVLTQGIGIPLTALGDTTFYQVFAGEVEGVPVPVFWSLLVVIVGVILFNRHRFGARVTVSGDNPESAKEMGINVAQTKITVYVFVGLCAALAGVISALINYTWWPTAGDGYLLRTLAAVFIGGTPTWGGVGTVVGAVFGAMSVGFIETGLIGSGLTAFWTQFAYGLVIILALIGHRFNQGRYR